MINFTKKIIAREFLLLLLCLVLVLLWMLAMVGWNYLKRADLVVVNKEIRNNNTLKKKSLTVFEQKRNERRSFFYDYVWHFHLAYTQTPDDMWSRLENLVHVDSIKLKWTTYDQSLRGFLRQKI